jgi:hypothetical protein
VALFTWIHPGQNLMRAHSYGWTCFSLLLVCCAYSFEVAAADTPAARTLIEQAVAAQGGLKALETIKASIVATKGTLNELGEATFHGEMFTKFPNQYRLVMNIETGGNRIPYVDVLSVDRGWNRVEEKLEEVTGPTLVDMQLQAYVSYVCSLTPLLNEEGFSVTTEARQQVANASAEVVVVRKKGKPDTRLYFDVQSHLLSKVEQTRFDPTTGKDARFEEFAQDYRVVDLLGADRKILADAKIGTDAAALETFLRNQSMSANEQTQAQGLIKSLGDDKFARREEAKEKLIKMGPRVRGLLEEATHSGDPEVATRARESLQLLGKGPSAELVGAVVRSLSFERDPKGLDALVAYLPSAADEGVAKEVRSALMAYSDRDPKVKQRLTDLSKTGDPSVRKAISRMLEAAARGAEGGYRVYPTGVKFAMKGTKLRDGKKTAEWETTEVRFYHSLPDSLFGKP